MTSVRSSLACRALVAAAVGVLTLAACSDDTTTNGDEDSNGNANADVADGTGSPGDATDAPTGTPADPPPVTEHPEIRQSVANWVAANEASSGPNAHCPLIELDEFIAETEGSTSAVADFAEWDVALDDIGTPEGNVVSIVCTALGGESGTHGGVSLAAVAPGLDIEEVIQGSVRHELTDMGDGPGGAGTIRVACPEGAAGAGSDGDAESTDAPTSAGSVCIGVWNDDTLMSITVLQNTDQEETAALINAVIPTVLDRAGDLG